MLTIFSGSGSRTCDGISRRDFIRVGGLALGSLSMNQLLEMRALAGQSGADFVRDKSVVLLYLSGGASHIETFDPKMTAPVGVRSVTGEVKTTLPGVTFGGTFPQLAGLAHKMAVVRSFAHPVGSHGEAHVHVLTGGTDRGGKGGEVASMGSMYARLRGANHPVTGMPTFALLTEKEIDGQYRKELGRIRAGSAPGGLGPSYAPFNHTGDEQADSGGRKNRKKRRRGDNDKPQKGSLRANMQLNMPPDRFDDRRLLLEKLDRLNRRIDASGTIEGMDKFNQQAVNLMLGGAAEAFDVAKEDRRTIERYDTSHVMIGKKLFRKSTLGKQMLMARRLCESGCGFVTVHSAGWDMHADGNNPGMVRGMEMLGRTLDQAVSAFIEDLAQRGLSDKILLVITGDFGRTPKMNARGGRDHWARLGTLAFAGGGLPMGQVIGQSARGADVPATTPVATPHLMATIMHTVFDIGTMRIVSGLPRELTSLVVDGEPIAELV